MELILNSYYKNNAEKLHKLVDDILKKLKFYDVDKEDFYSLANEIFVDVLKRYDNEKSFNGFLYSCLTNKFKTEMTRRNRQKRQTDKMSISWDTPVSDNGEITLKDIVPDNETIESELFNKENKDEWRKEIKEYLASLSPLQRQIALLLSDKNTPEEICEELHITMKHFENSMRRILADERIRPLRTLI